MHTASFSFVHRGDETLRADSGVAAREPVVRPTPVCVRPTAPCARGYAYFLSDKVQ